MDIVEPGNTIQLTFVSSIAPDYAPYVVISDAYSTVLSSITSISSDSNNYYAMFTAPSTEGVLAAKWIADKSVSGSIHLFTKVILFNVKMTRGAY